MRLLRGAQVEPDRPVVVQDRREVGDVQFRDRSSSTRRDLADSGEREVEDEALVRSTAHEKLHVIVPARGALRFDHGAEFAVPTKQLNFSSKLSWIDSGIARSEVRKGFPSICRLRGSSRSAAER